MIQSNLSPSFWAEALATANYVRNRCPSRSINGEIPYTRWTGKKPSLIHMKIFGVKALMLDENTKKGKLESRSKDCIFIGYSDVSKAYRLWVPAEKKIVRSRNVKFLGEFDNQRTYEDFISPEIYSKYSLRSKTEVQITSMPEKPIEEIHET